MRPRIKVTPAVVIASLALVVAASGGTAYAAAKIGSAEIEDNSIRGVDIRANEVRSSDVKDGALLPRDFAPGTLTSGSKGEKGDKGEAGEQGPAGAGRWVLVDKDGTIAAQSGGFSINAAYPTLASTATPDNSLRAAGNVYINANEDLSNNGITVSIALQNATDQDGNANVNGRAGGSDANAEFSGEITSTICGVTGIVACAPPGANTRSHFVVSPRLSDGGLTFGSVPGDGPGAGLNTHKRFYVIITGDSTDFVSPTPAIPAKVLAANPPA